VTDAATPVPEADAVGIPAVDAILQGLGVLAERPVTEHVAAYERIHADLQDALADAADRSDDGPAHPEGAR